jgi:hypothetical protein
MTPTSTDRSARLLADDARAGLRQRWQHIVERFVDDPESTVRAADALVADVIDHIRSSLDHRRSATGDGGPDPQDATTEQLRAALNRYERLFEQLTDAPAPDAWHDDPD